MKSFTNGPAPQQAEFDALKQPFTGATSSAAGNKGLVPAPAAGDNAKFLCADGNWAVPVGGKMAVFTLDTVTNTSGSYTHTTQISDVTSEMKVIEIEVSNPEAFLDTITITTADGTITLSCNSVSGTSSVKVACLFSAGADSITSSEFDVLSGRIGTLSQLQTTDKSSLVAAVNEHEGDISSINGDITSINGKLGTVQSGKTLQGQIDTLSSNFSKLSKVLWQGDAFTSGSISVPELGNYRIWVFYFSDTVSMLVTAAGSNTILWGGSSIGTYGSEGINTVACRYAVSGTTISIDASNRGYTDGTKSNYGGNTVGLVRIAGIV